VSDSKIDPTRPVEVPHHRASWKVRLRRALVAGLVILVPVTLTIFILIKIFRFMGLGVLLTIIVVLLLGWLSTNVVGRSLIQATERLICRIPVAKSIYSATKGFLETLSFKQTEAFKKVVLIEYPKENIFALAFVTGWASWPTVDERLTDTVMVFVPTTPNPTSGFLLLVPREETIELPISIEEGIRLVISGGILLPEMAPLMDTPTQSLP
jgi:uncharacterized membrane protein